MRDRWECRVGLFAAKATPTSLSGTDGVGFPGVPGDGMPGKNVQRKLGTTRGSPRRSRTAKASRISRQAVKSRCAREWGGWGRLSDDGPGHYNPDPSEGPWGRWSIPPHGGAVIASTDPTLCGSTLKHDGRRQTERRSANAGSRLKLIDVWGRSRLIRQPFSRAGLFAAKAMPTSLSGTVDDRAPRGPRGRHARKECAAKARNHSRVA